MSYLLEDMRKTANINEEETGEKEKRRQRRINLVGGTMSALGLGAGIDQLRRSGKHKATAKDFAQKAKDAATRAESSRTQARLSQELADALSGPIAEAKNRQLSSIKAEDVFDASSKAQNAEVRAVLQKIKYNHAEQATKTLGNRLDINAQRWKPGRHMAHYQVDLKRYGRELNEMLHDKDITPDDLASHRAEIKKRTQWFKELHDQRPDALKNHPHDQKYWYKASNQLEKWKDKKKTYLHDLQSAQDKKIKADRNFHDLTEKFQKNPYNPDEVKLLLNKRDQHEADRTNQVSNAANLDYDIVNYNTSSADSTQKSKKHRIRAGLGLAVPAAFAGYKLKQRYDQKKRQKEKTKKGW